VNRVGRPAKQSGKKNGGVVLDKVVVRSGLASKDTWGLVRNGDEGDKGSKVETKHRGGGK